MEGEVVEAGRQKQEIMEGRERCWEGNRKGEERRRGTERLEKAEEGRKEGTGDDGGVIKGREGIKSEEV